jgi:tripartite-type tricarboxylate transporter receptor subunit TctC
MERRKFLKTVPAGVATAAIAGCSENQTENSGGTGDGGDGGDSEDAGNGGDTDSGASEEDAVWPPGNRVEAIIPFAPGGSEETLTRIWGSGLERIWRDEGYDLDHIVTNRPAAEGMLAYNDVYDAQPDGGVYGTCTYNEAIPFQMFRDATSYDVSDYVHIKTMYRRIRGIQISPHSTSVEDHFDWDWDTFVEKIPDLQIGTAGVWQVMLGYFIAEQEDRLDHDDIDMVQFGSGSDVRAAVMREDIDGYFGGFASNRAGERTDIYKTQLAIVDDRYPDVLDNVMELDDEAVTIQDTTFAGNYEKVVDMTQDAVSFTLPPETPEEVVEAYDSAYNRLYEEQEDRIRAEIEEAFGDATILYHEGSHESAEEFASTKYENLTDNREDIKAIIEGFQE